MMKNQFEGWLYSPEFNVVRDDGGWEVGFIEDGYLIFLGGKREKVKVRIGPKSVRLYTIEEDI